MNRKEKGYPTDVSDGRSRSGGRCLSGKKTSTGTFGSPNLLACWFKSAAKQTPPSPERNAVLLKPLSCTFVWDRRLPTPLGAPAARSLEDEYISDLPLRIEEARI